MEEVKTQIVAKQNYTQNRRKIFSVYSVFLFGVSLALPAIAEAASLHFSPSSGSYAHGQNFSVSVLVNADQSANAVRGVILFPTEYISVISVDYTDTVVDLWVQKPSFSNSSVDGNVIFEGVILNPGFTGSGGKIFNIILKVKKQGSASVRMTDFAVLANDGLGTNIAVASDDANFAFTKPLPQGESKSVEDKINTIGEKVKKIEEQNKLLHLVQESDFYQRIDNLWKILPLWIKFVAIILIGAAIVFSLFVFSLIIVLVIWAWNYLRYRREYVRFQFEHFIKTIKLFSRKIMLFLGMVEKELESDIVYDYDQLKENYREAKRHLSIKKLLKDHFSMSTRIIKRFFIINSKKR
ncbi:MAG: hypothetical protein HYT39_00705 [Candidatus Sungbacteria bacterium]|nr:hypothetical protein [Candidatus Sungbacteria bacterium]